ncbi:MAG: hypothetical protein HYV93_16220 [Candidatus Rokubacteria bacterium]|nr:hypothetical protein [Candidatus Rokubacteria bacterium]
MKFKGIRKATRYRVAGTSKGTPGVNELTIIGAKEGYPSFITIFEFDSAEDFQKYEASPEFAAAQRDWFARKGELKVEAFWRAQFESIASWER